MLTIAVEGDVKIQKPPRRKKKAVEQALLSPDQQDTSTEDGKLLFNLKHSATCSKLSETVLMSLNMPLQNLQFLFVLF